MLFSFCLLLLWLMSKFISLKWRNNLRDIEESWPNREKYQKIKTNNLNLETILSNKGNEYIEVSHISAMIGTQTNFC